MHIFRLFSTLLLIHMCDITLSTQSVDITSASAVLKLATEFIDSREKDEYPTVTMSYAQTLDGSIAPTNRTRWNLSSKVSFQLLHSIRARSDGVLIGIKTLFADQPQLNIRNQLDGYEIPHARTRPIIIDSQLKFLQLNPQELRINRPIICCCVKPSDPLYTLAQAKIAELGGSIICCQQDKDGRVDLKDVFKQLKKKCNIHSLLVEGGAEIIQSVLHHSLCHQVIITLKPIYFGGYRSLTQQLPYPILLQNVTVTQVENDFIVYGILPPPSPPPPPSPASS